MITKNLPKISIITPSYNQGTLIEETIKSVLSQKYQNLEYIIIDALSTDGTLNILKKYQKYIIWKRELDSGQSDALNKGLKMATGEIIGFLNADDIYLPEALNTVASYFKSEKNIMWAIGGCEIIDDKGKKTRNIVKLWKDFCWQIARASNLEQSILLILNYIPQPSTFWRKNSVGASNIFDQKLKFTMDYDLWLRLGRRYTPGMIKYNLAAFRIHKDSKGSKFYPAQMQEGLKVASRYTNSKAILSLHKLHDKGTIGLYKIFNQELISQHG